MVLVHYTPVSVDHKIRVLGDAPKAKPCTLL